MVSFPSAAVALLASGENDMEQLSFSLINAHKVHALIPNKQVKEEKRFFIFYRFYTSLSC